MGAHLFANMDPQGARAGAGQNFGIDQTVRINHIRRAQPVQRAQGQKVARTRASADKGDAADLRRAFQWK